MMRLSLLRSKSTLSRVPFFQPRVINSTRASLCASQRAFFCQNNKFSPSTWNPGLETEENVEQERSEQEDEESRHLNGLFAEQVQHKDLAGATDTFVKFRQNDSLPSDHLALARYMNQLTQHHDLTLSNSIETAGMVEKPELNDDRILKQLFSGSNVAIDDEIHKDLINQANALTLEVYYSFLQNEENLSKGVLDCFLARYARLDDEHHVDSVFWEMREELSYKPDINSVHGIMLGYTAVGLGHKAVHALQKLFGLGLKPNHTTKLILCQALRRNNQAQALESLEKELEEYDRKLLKRITPQYLNTKRIAESLHKKEDQKVETLEDFLNIDPNNREQLLALEEKAKQLISGLMPQ